MQLPLPLTSGASQLDKECPPSQPYGAEGLHPKIGAQSFFRCREVEQLGQLVGLISRRSQVQILPSPRTKFPLMKEQLMLLSTLSAAAHDIDWSLVGAAVLNVTGALLTAIF